MRFSELIPLTACLVNLSLTLFVFRRDPRALLSRVYLLWGLSITVWNAGVFFLFRVESHAEALFWARFLQFGVIFLPVSLFHLALLATEHSARRWLGPVYGLLIALAFTNFTDFFVADVKYVGYAYYSVGGRGFWIFVASYVALTTATMAILYRRTQIMPSLYRKRITSLLWACGILIFFGTNDLLPILGIYYYPFTRVPIYPFGSLGAIFYGMIVGYSVLQNQLLDIHVTLGRLAAHLVRLLFLFLVGLALLLAITAVFPSYLPRSAFIIALSVLLISAVVASYFFPRLFGSGSDALERRILGDRFEYHDKIQGFIESVPWYSDLSSLFKDLQDLLVKTMRVRNYTIILLEETTRAYSVFHSYPESSIEPRVKLQTDSPIFKFFQQTQAEFFTFNPGYSLDGATQVTHVARRDLAAFGCDFCFPFMWESHPIGLLLIGAKDSGEVYTPHDLHLLTLLVKNLGLIVNQIRLKQQVDFVQEMELLGIMSRGMAHDLNNLVTPAWTYLQISANGGADKEANQELLPVAMRNIETMRAYIREALFFSQTHAPQFKPIPLESVVQSSLSLVEPQLREKGITVDYRCAPATIELDEILLQRALCNLLSNAIDASPKNMPITVELIRMPKTEAGRDWMRLIISDRGEGISPENLKRIFTPYFTTKDQSSERRGFGLGLAISRKIVHLHGGNLNIASEQKKGTTVLVDLPSEQLNKPPMFLRRSV